MVLSDFEGKAVRQAGLEIPSAAGGLREALAIAPQEFHQGDTVFVVFELVTQKVRFDPINKNAPDEDQRRVHVFTVKNATFVDEQIVRAQLDEQSRLAAEAREAREAARRQREGMPDLSDHIDQLVAQHEAGGHAELVADCPACQDEEAAQAAQAAEARG